MSRGNAELKSILEAALFAADAPLSVARLIGLFPLDAEPSREEVRDALGDLERDYAGRGIELRRLGNAYRFQSVERFSPWLRKLTEGRSLRYTRALLETLAIIAYRQPVTRGDIEEIRGVTVSSETMKTLLDRQWVKQVGQREVPGRPALFGTTQQFLEYFNLPRLGDLPPLMEKRDPADIARELNLSLPFEETEATPEEEEEAEEAEKPHTAEIIHLDTRGE